MKKFKEIKKIKEARDMGDYLGMDKKQKMKFDQLMKKLDGGKEHMKFRRMAKTPVQGDDMFHGYVKDLATGAIKETVQVQEAIPFSDAQLSKMKKSYATLKTIDPSSQNYKKLKTAIRKLDVDRLEQIARAKIRFVSTIAAGEYAIKSGKRLHARDYLESTELEENVKISFHSKGAKTKWMKKQAVSPKEIINQTPTSIELPSRWKDLSKKKDHDEIFSVELDESVQINEVQQKEVDALKKLSKDMQAVLKDFQKIAAMGDKELKNSKYNKDYQAVLKSRDTILSLIGKVQFKLAQQGLKALKKENFELDEGYFNKELESGQYTPGMEKMYVDIIKKNGGKNIEVNKPTSREPSLSIDFDGGNIRKMEKDIEGKGDGTETLDESVKISFHSKGAKTKWMKKQAVASKEIINQTPTSVELPPRWKDLSKKKDHDEIFSVVSESMARARADARRDMGGRGAQRGMAPLKKDVDNSATDGDRKAASKHIIQQIRKAADLPNGAEVEFKNGKGKVDRNSAQMVLKKYLAMKKPMDKEKFQKNIKSLSDIKKILGR